MFFLDSTATVYYQPPGEMEIVQQCTTVILIFCFFGIGAPYVFSGCSVLAIPGPPHIVAGVCKACSIKYTFTPKNPLFCVR